MKGFQRPYPLFSLCGLKCGLCPMHHMTDGCPGCGGGEGNQSCSIARCSLAHGGLEYCFQCPDYPCKEYDDFDAYDGFLAHRNRSEDIRRAMELGPEDHRMELDEKVERLSWLLAHYNDGRRKSFFCTAVNVLDLADLRTVMDQIAAQVPLDLDPKERGAQAAALVQAMADARGRSLKLTRKPREKK